MELLKLTPFQETLHEAMCGPASLKIVLDYYGIDKSEQELADLMGKTDEGTDEYGFRTAAESLGLEFKMKNEAELSDIQNFLKDDVPVIVNWFTRGRADYSDSDIADGHYSVVAGLDDKYIYLQDPELGILRTLRRDDFARVWFDFSGKYISRDGLIVRQLIAISRK
ncbi:MAG: C39 family peptidase [Candidatus Parcubacteria bacterium]|nr:C39 family peptidase [Candidatus Parcubacteria bacterium]